MKTSFNDLPWHDAELKEIIIDRDQKNNVKITIRWPDTYGGNCESLEFFKCYGLIANMHFGVTPPDSILDAECITESLELDKVKKIWAKMGVDLSKIYCFRIVTNSTNSTIDIFALGFHILNVE